jgi:hypothetical protein
MNIYDEDGEAYDVIAQEKHPDGKIIVKRRKKPEHPSHHQILAGVMYYLDWSTKYMKAAREGNADEMKVLEANWNPEKVIYAKKR